MRHGTSSLGKLALGVAAILLGRVELAQAICFGDPTRFISYSGPENISVPRDVPDGTLLYSETKTLPRSSFECTSQELWGLDLASGRGPSPTSKTIDFPIGVSGLSFRIKVGLGSGMGYVASLDPLKWGAYYLRDEMILEIYKRGALAPSGVVRAGDLGVVKFGSKNIVDIALGLNINVVALSCESPDVNVAMGDDYKLVDFGDPGSTTRAVPFNITLNNCPSGITKVNYQLQALTPVVDAAQGVVGLNATSTAVGIGLQIKDANGQPVPLNTPRTFTGYDTGGGDFLIPFTASYYRMAMESLRPGSANTEITFIMSYL